MKRMKLSFMLALIALLFVGVTVAYAGDVHVRTIPAGSNFVGDIEVFSDDFELEEDASVSGDIAIIGGDARIAGAIQGDLFVLGGDVELMETMSITGDCVFIGGDVDNASAVECATIGEGDFRLGDFLPAIDIESDPSPPDLGHRGQSNAGGASLGGTIFSTIFFGIVGFFFAAVAPRRVERIGNAAASKPVVIGTVGFLTLLAMLAILTIAAILTGLLLVVIVGILGIPVLIGIVALLALGLLVGWVGVGRIVGATLADALRLNQLNPRTMTALGTAALTFGVGLLQLMPLIGFSGSIAAFVIAAIGLGSVALTRFGAVSYPRLLVDSQKVIDQIKFADEDEIGL